MLNFRGKARAHARNGLLRPPAASPVTVTCQRMGWRRLSEAGGPAPLNPGQRGEKPGGPRGSGHSPSSRAGNGRFPHCQESDRAGSAPGKRRSSETNTNHQNLPQEDLCSPPPLGDTSVDCHHGSTYWNTNPRVQRVRVPTKTKTC